MDKMEYEVSVTENSATETFYICRGERRLVSLLKCLSTKGTKIKVLHLVGAEPAFNTIRKFVESTNV